jgi:hypothetical protein
MDGHMQQLGLSIHRDQQPAYYRLGELEAGGDHDVNIAGLRVLKHNL